MSALTMAQELTFDDFQQNVIDGCPEVWHDLTVTIDPEAVSGSMFGASPDEADFRTKYQAVYGVPDPITPAEMNAVIANPAAVSLACNAHRKDFFQALLSTNTADTAAALQAALGVANAIDFSSRNWRVGDIRVTSRTMADDGWVFPYGQTVGSETSGADLAGEMYKDLFEVVKLMDGNDATTTWESNQAVTLPDFRGRALYAANNMGGSTPTVAGGATSKPVLDAQAGKIGGLFGFEKYIMTLAQMPNHNHAMNTVANHGHTSNNAGVHAHTSNTVGNHTHGMYNSPSHSHSSGYAGTHGHSIRTSVYSGSNVPNYGRYFEGKGRPGYQSTKSSPVRSAGNHKHTIGAGGVHKHTVAGAGSHRHTINNAGNHAHSINAAGGHKHNNVAAGSSAALTTTSPGIAMNVEMKY